MPRYIRKGIKHGGVTGSGRPNTVRTKIIPGSNPRGDGKLQCGHPATQPARWLARKTPRYEWDTDVRRVCETCFQQAIADPESIWHEVDENYQRPGSGRPVETPMEKENRELRTLANVLISRLNARPDWPLVQKLAGICLATEDMLNTGTDAATDAQLEALFSRLMDRDVTQFMIKMDRMNLLPDGRHGRLRALPTDLKPIVSLDPHSKWEVETTLIAMVQDSYKIGEADRSGVNHD